MSVQHFKVPSVVKSAMMVELSIKINAILIGAIGVEQATGVNQNFDIKFQLRKVPKIEYGKELEFHHSGNFNTSYLHNT